MEENIKVMIFEPAKRPYLKVVKNDLEAVQEIVGGYIEAVPYKLPNAVIICNEEGLIFDLPFNRGLRGTFFAVGVKGDEFVSLTEEQINYLDVAGVWLI